MSSHTSRVPDGGRRGSGRPILLAGLLVAWLMVTLLLALPVRAGATEPAGRVVFSAGEVVAVDDAGNRRTLTRNDVVYPGETVRTSRRAWVDLRMRDNALISLEPESAFALERYGFETELARIGRAVMRFLHGSLRTITGTIGKDRRDTYELHTPVATIGVRGTQYALQFCDAACAGADRPSGLYGHVGEGAISVTNSAAREIMSRGDYFYVEDSDVAPRTIVRPPEGILESSRDAAGTSEQQEDDTTSLVGSDTSLLDSDDSLLLRDDGLLSDSPDAGDSLLSPTGTELDSDGSTTGGLLDLLRSQQ